MEMFTYCSYQRQMAHQISTCYPCTAVDWKPPNRGVVLEPESLGLLLLRERWFHGPQGERPGQAESEAIWISPKMVSVSRNMVFFCIKKQDSTKKHDCHLGNREILGWNVHHLHDLCCTYTATSREMVVSPYKYPKMALALALKDSSLHRQMMLT